MINFDAALGNHVQALGIYSRRAKILSSNIVNADTPGYKARDLDFRSILGKQQLKTVRMEASEPGDISQPAVSGGFDQLLYRNPMQPSLDGNTVDTQKEVAAFSENALRYQATLQFLSGKFRGITSALRGE